MLAEDVVVDGGRTLDPENGLNMDGVGVKVLELEDVVKFGWIIKPRLINLLPIKPGGRPVDVSLPVGS